MDDVRGDVLRPPHGTTPAAVKSNKNQKWDPLRPYPTASSDLCVRKLGIITVSWELAVELYFTTNLYKR